MLIPSRQTDPATTRAAVVRHTLKLLGMLAVGVLALVVMPHSTFVGVMALAWMVLIGAMIHFSEKWKADPWSRNMPGYLATQKLLAEIARRRRNGETFGFAYGTARR